eukprot:CAMPEP_0181226304 /NCGR_PEP_ID=MMETSP1096-20121128/32185_1 /TAXON_ID=156174 ORGANISM="Chrysochromulina ericina, Strain CCMP281" /NCGR_SAMPLE_ID=MMETSP1096 /ASSEMBLY_ACC=CAM_ASM_000453 /LENGTH=33 /DNA_ID= /DNA_START= /DNA_END= /DNA_ORIENTATION=
MPEDDSSRSISESYLGASAPNVAQRSHGVGSGG